MARAAADGAAASYETTGGGAGGKFRKRPNRRAQTTPYDRPPPTALRNNPVRNTGTWLSKLVVDPASKLISSTAHYFFSPLLRKRLPPPQPPEDNQENRERHHEEVPYIHASAQETTIDEGGNLANSSDGSGFSELERMLKQKTFTRSEIDRLTNLLRSRTVDLPVVDEEKRTEVNLPKPVSGFGRHQEFASTPAKENRNEREGFHGFISTPGVSARVFEEDVASPAELAKAYMGSRPSKVSPSMLGLRSQIMREDATLSNYVLVPTKSPIMSLLPKTAVRVGVLDNAFTTPRSRGRSAIYSMARTPYPRVHSTASQKGIESTNFGHSGQPLLSSSSREWEHDGQLGSKQVTLKRRSSVLDDDIESVGSMRRTRQKPHLVSQSQGGYHPSTRGMKEHKDRAPKTVGENDDNSFPSTSYASVPSKSSEIATKILQHLEKLSPKEKLSGSKLAAAWEKSPAKLTPNMLHAQAHSNLEDLDLSKLLQNSHDNHKLEDLRNHSLRDARDYSSRKPDKVEENGSKELLVPCDILTPAVNGDTTVSHKDAIPTSKMADSTIMKFVTQSPQNKRSFLMSAHEDSSELDDGIRGNGSASTLVADGKGKQESSKVESKAVSAEAITLDKAPALPEVKTAVDPVPNKRFDLEIADGSKAGDKNAGFSFPASPRTTFQPAVPSQSTSDKIVPPKEANTPLLFSFSSKNFNEVPQPFSFSFSVDGSSGPKSSAWLDSNKESSNSLTHVASGPTDTQPKVPESDIVVKKNIQKAADMIGKSETSLAVSTSASASNIFSFGNPANNSSPSTSASASNIFAFGNSANNSSSNKGSLTSSPDIFPSTSPVLSSSNLTNPIVTNNSTLVASSTSTASLNTAGSTAASTAVSNSSLSLSTGAPSFPAPLVFKFGSSVFPSTSFSAFSTTSSKETTDTTNASKKEMTCGNVISSPFGGTSFAMVASSASSIFGFSPSVTSTANNQSQGSLFGTGNGSLVSAQLPSTESVVAIVSQTLPIQFGGSASSPIFGTSGSTSFTSSSSLFGSSTPAVKLFGSGASFGLSSSASSSETNPVSSSTGPTSSIFNFGASSSSSSGTNSASSSSSAPSSIFGSSWQPKKSPIVTSAFNTLSSSTGFSFGASSNSVAASNNASLLFGSSTGSTSASIFSFTTASAMTSSSPSLSQTQPVIGNSTPVFSAASGNSDQMNMEDSMAEDPVQVSTPAVPIFGQSPISPSPTGFMFGSTAPSPANPFLFGGQQNQVTPQNPSPFQASSSLEFSTGGSFSLGTGGGTDKSTRRMIKVKKTRKK